MGLLKSNIRKELAKAADFAGRYAIVQWSCGTWCANSLIAEYGTGRIVETPFVGVVGCRSITGDHPTMERRINSNLLIIRGMFELSDDGYFYETPCGTFHLAWNNNRFRLIGCNVPSRPS